jgi:hypothetical protein
VLGLSVLRQPDHFVASGDDRDQLPGGGEGQVPFHRGDFGHRLRHHRRGCFGDDTYGNVGNGSQQGTVPNPVEVLVNW